MKFTLPSRRDLAYSSLDWHDSKIMPGVRFAVRKTSLAQRIDLAEKTRHLFARHEFLRAGDTGDQVEAALGELMVRRLYLEWGLIGLENLTIDAQAATVGLLIERGPEALSAEIATVIGDSLTLTQEERKNF